MSVGESDEQEIRKIHSMWMNAVNGGDLDRLLTLMTDDVVFLGPGHAPFGRDGFSDNFSAALRQFRFHCRSELEEVAVIGDVAYTRCRWLLARDAHTLSSAEKK